MLSNEDFTAFKKFIVTNKNVEPSIAIEKTLPILKVILGAQPNWQIIEIIETILADSSDQSNIQTIKILQKCVNGFKTQNSEESIIDTTQDIPYLSTNTKI